MIGRVREIWRGWLRQRRPVDETTRSGPDSVVRGRDDSPPTDTPIVTPKRRRACRATSVRVGEGHVAVVLTDAEALALRRFCGCSIPSDFRDRWERAAFSRAYGKLWDAMSGVVIHPDDPDDPDDWDPLDGAAEPPDPAEVLNEMRPIVSAEDG